MNSFEEKISEKLREALHPTVMKLVNESHKHRGHAGYNTNSHFSLKISAPVFKTMTRVQSHQLVYEILSEEMAGELHALTIQIVL